MLACFFNSKDMCVGGGILLLTFAYLFWVARPLGFEEVRYYFVDEGYYTGRGIGGCHQLPFIWAFLSRNNEPHLKQFLHTSIFSLFLHSGGACTNTFIPSIYLRL